MNLRECSDYTIKWGRGRAGSGGGGVVDNKMGEGGYDFYISAFTGNGKYTYITFRTDVSSRDFFNLHIHWLFCSLVGICSVCISNMIMIVCVHCSFLIWLSPVIFILHLKVLPRGFIKLRENYIKICEKHLNLHTLKSYWRNTQILVQVLTNENVIQTSCFEPTLNKCLVYLGLLF